MSPPDEPWEEMAGNFQRWAEETLNGTGPLAVPNAFQDALSDVVEALRAAVFELERGRDSSIHSDALDRTIADGREALARADQLPVTDAEPSVSIVDLDAEESAANRANEASALTGALREYKLPPGQLAFQAALPRPDAELEGGGLRIVTAYVEAGEHNEANEITITDGERSAVYVPHRIVKERIAR